MAPHKTLMRKNSSDLPLVVWGTYDLGKPRVRILLRGLTEAGQQTVTIHGSIWGGIQDKSQLRNLATWLVIGLRLAMCYPILLGKYLTAPKHRYVLLPYLSTLDLLLLWPFAKLRRAKLVWDVFVPLYGGIVEDRKMLNSKSLFARLIYGFEALSARLADCCFLDTEAHAEYFAATYKLDRSRVGAVPVGVEPEAFPIAPRPNQNSDNHNINGSIKLLFYGQFIPLHGAETILKAAQLAKDMDIEWTVIGSGQKAPLLKKFAAEAKLEKLKWIDWVDYKQLSKHIHDAEICLGIFGITAKAQMVIPNKVYQVIASGKPIITMESPAMRELKEILDFPVRFVPPGDHEALLATIVEYSKQLRKHSGTIIQPTLDRITPKAIGQKFLSTLEDFERRL